MKRLPLTFQCEGSTLAATLDTGPLTTGLLYILLFGFGSIIGMAALSFVIAIPLRQSAKGLTRLNFAIQSVFASFTLVIGVSLVSETIPALLTFQ